MRNEIIARFVYNQAKNQARFVHNPQRSMYGRSE